MTVLELIKLLQTFPSTLPVAYCCCSEQVMMKPEEIIILEAGKARPDGWVQNKRPDKPSQSYLLFPGN